MNLDKFTYGNSPAAIYLVDRLNEIGSPKFNRKIASVIVEVRTMITQTVNAQEAGIITMETVAFIANALRQKIVQAANGLLTNELELSVKGVALPDTLALNLMSNILIGDVKSLVRKTRGAKVILKNQARQIQQLGDVDTSLFTVVPRQITVNSVKDEKTSEVLVERSKKRLARRGIPSKLY